MKTIPCIVFCSLWLDSCAHMSEAQYAVQMKAWEGKSERALIDAFGYPHQKHTSPEGNEVYEYVAREQYVMEEGGFYRRHFWGPMRSTLITLECRTWFELVNKTIAKVTWKGDDCVAGEP